MVALHTRAYELQARAFIENPSADELRSFTAQMPNARQTGCGNLDVFTRADARSIAVDRDNGITRVFNSDYFGESKKGGLRMWNKIVYDKGGLPMHAGCKVVPTAAGTKTIVIIGLSGTGKTTSTFRHQNGSK